MRKYFALCLSLLVVSFAIGCSSGHTTAITSPTPTAPSAPTALTATAGNGQVVLSWTGSTGATSYNLYYGTATGVTTATGTKISAITATTYTQTGLTNGTGYFYIVTAVNATGESVASAQATATPVLPAPAAPANLTATAGNGQVVLSWTASAGATSYNLYFGTATGVTTATGTKISAITATTYTQTGLTNGTAYFYIVTAVDASGESVASAQATATPVLPIPAAPTTLTAVGSDTQIALSWTASSGAVSYNLYYSTTAGVTTGTGTKIAGITANSYTQTGLVDGTTYYYIVTAIDGSGESPASNQASATPGAGISVNLIPGTAASGTLQDNATTSLTFNFPANAVSQAAVATIMPLTQAALPTPLDHGHMGNARLLPRVVPADTYIGGFSVAVSPSSITSFNAPVTISGSVGSSVPVSTTLNLAVLQSGSYVDVGTIVVGTSGTLTENLPSTTLPGLVSAGTYIIYQPAAGTSTSVSNFGIALIADDSNGMADGSDGIQVVHIYDSAGNLLPTPTVTYLDYSGAGDLDGEALTPDGSQGIMVDGGNTLRFFTQTQTGTPVASTTTLDTTGYGGDGDSVAILPTGDEAVVSGDDQSLLLVVSGIVSGNPVAAQTISIPDNRDGVVVSNDGKVLLARGGSGLTVYSIGVINPTPGTIGGTVSHTYTQVVDLPALGSGGYSEDGRNGMAISPTDSSRAAIVQSSSAGYTIQLVTGLTSTPVAGTAVDLPLTASPFAVAVTPDGKNAIVGTYSGLLLYSGVDTGTLTQVGSLYAPTYTVGTVSATLAYVTTLGVTLDNKYVLAGDAQNHALVVVPFTAAGFATAPASSVSIQGIPNNDQLLVH